MEPWQQEDLRQANWDKQVNDLPACGCCKRKVYPGDTVYKLTIGRQIITVCADCKIDMDDSVQILEQ